MTKKEKNQILEALYRQIEYCEKNANNFPDSRDFWCAKIAGLQCAIAIVKSF